MLQRPVGLGLHPWSRGFVGSAGAGSVDMALPDVTVLQFLYGGTAMVGNLYQDRPSALKVTLTSDDEFKPLGEPSEPNSADHGGRDLEAHYRIKCYSPVPTLHRGLQAAPPLPPHFGIIPGEA